MINMDMFDGREPNAKAFEPNKKYRVGVKTTKKKNAKEIEFDEKDFSKLLPGSYFIEKGCPDVDSYLRNNPDNLNPQKIYHFYSVDDSNELKYFDAGNPYQLIGRQVALDTPIEQKDSEIKAATLSDKQEEVIPIAPMQPQAFQMPMATPPPQIVTPPVFVHNTEGFEDVLLKSKEYEKQMYEMQIAAMQNSFTQMQASFESQINYLKMTISDLRENGNGEAKYLRQLLQSKETEIREQNERYESALDSLQERIIEEKEKMLQKEVEFNALKSEFENYKKEATLRDEIAAEHEETIQTLSDELEEKSKGLGAKILGNDAVISTLVPIGAKLLENLMQFTQMKVKQAQQANNYGPMQQGQPYYPMSQDHIYPNHAQQFNPQFVPPAAGPVNSVAEQESNTNRQTRRGGKRRDEIEAELQAELEKRKMKSQNVNNSAPESGDGASF